MNKSSAFLFCALGAGLVAAAQVLSQVPTLVSAAPEVTMPAAPAVVPAAPVAAAAPAVVTSAQEQREFADAVALYRAGKWSAAYGRFATLADRGHPRAARIALAMFRDGPRLYDTAWDAGDSQLVAWERAAQPEHSNSMAALDKRQDAR